MRSRMISRWLSLIKCKVEDILKNMILCECGEFIAGHTFKDFIPTSSNPSTPTIGHCRCGLIFDFVDGKLPKRYSSRVILKGIAMRFAEVKGLNSEEQCGFLLEVDRLKSNGDLSDAEILLRAYDIFNKK